MKVKDLKEMVSFWRNKAKNAKSKGWKNRFLHNKNMYERELKTVRSFNSFKRYGQFNRHLIVGPEIMSIEKPWTRPSLYDYWMWYVRTKFDGDETKAKKFQMEFYFKFFHSNGE